MRMEFRRVSLERSKGKGSRERSWVKAHVNEVRERPT